MNDFGDLENMFRRAGLLVPLSSLACSTNEPLSTLFYSIDALSIFLFNLWLARSSLSMVRSDIYDFAERDFCEDLLCAGKLDGHCVVKLSSTCTT